MSWRYGCVVLLIAGLAGTLCADEPPADPHKTDSQVSAGQDAVHPGGSGGHGAHGHDLGHLNGSPSLEDPSQFKSDLAIWTFIVFLCLLAVLAKFAWRPILEGLEKRERSIAEMIEQAEKSAKKAAEQLQIYERRLAAAADEARAVVADAHKRAEADADRIRATAEADAEKQRVRALADIETAKNNAVRELAQQSVVAAVGLASRLVQREIRQDDHMQLINEALERFPSRN